MIRFSCAHCARHITVDKKYCGKKGKCPNCGNVVVVPDCSTVIAFNCSNCGHKINVPAAHAGRKGKCPKCGNLLVVPSQPERPARIGKTATAICPACGENVSVPKGTSQEPIACPACGNYIETTPDHETPPPPDPYDDVYEAEQQENDEYEESSAIDRRLIYIISGVAAVIALGLIILVTAILPSIKRPSEKPRDLQAGQIVPHIGRQSQPTVSSTLSAESFGSESPNKPEQQSSVTAESTERESAIQKLLEDAVAKEIHKQQGALVALYLDAGKTRNARARAKYRLYRHPRTAGSIGDNAVPYGVPWTRWERVAEATKREIVIDPGPPYKNFEKVVTLRPGQVTNLGHIILEKVQAEGTASISGTVTNENGAPVEGVRVSSPKRSATTNAKGLYRIDGFGLEAFDLVAEKRGYVSDIAEISIRDMDKRLIKQDFVLSFPRQVKFHYAISTKEQDNFSGPGATSGTAEFLVNRPRFRIPLGQIEDQHFKTFADRVVPQFWLDEGKLTMQSFLPVLYKVLPPSSSGQFAAIKSVGTLDRNSQMCPSIQEGCIVLIDGADASEYTLKMLLEEARPIVPPKKDAAQRMANRPPTQPYRQAISYDDFPPDVQEVLDERIPYLRSNPGAVSMAGRVTLADGAAIHGSKDVMLILRHGIDNHLRVHEGGWFITPIIPHSQHAGPDKRLALRAFGYDPVDASITVSQGEMTYVGFEMQKTPPEKLACIKGTVTDDNGRPLEQASLMLHFAFEYRYQPPVLWAHTGSNGTYSFEGLAGTDYRLFLTKPAYGSESVMITAPQGQTVVKNVKLYRGHKITIDYVYQADGSSSFTAGDLQTGAVTWDVYASIDFSTGQVERNRKDKDLELRQEKGVVKFVISRIRGRKGFYDAGQVSFDSVTEATQTEYTTDPVICQVGHVYVVRTSAEDNYAKFIVKSCERY